MGRMLNALSDRALELGPARAAEQHGNWRAATDGDYVYWLVLDRPDKAVNTIDRSVIEELSQHVDRIIDQKPSAVVIRSAKPSGFAAGADIQQFAGASTGEIRGMLKEAHLVLDRLAEVQAKTIAVINGHCLGAGLELALACDLRIAVSDASLGFPEVMLGLHPGLGGTYRATAIADPLEAMTMMLTGKSVTAKKAKVIGLVDAVVEERHVGAAVQAALYNELKTAAGGFKTQAFSLRPARALAASQMRKKTEEKAAKAHYPAPYRLIDLWEAHGGNAKAMQEAEIDSFAELIETDTAQNLVRVFFLRETMRGLKQGESAIKNVHVIGAGAMGGDIAAWAAREGFHVTLGDVATQPIGKAIRAATKMLTATLKDPLKIRDALDRLTPDPSGLGIAHADIVIEAAPEKLELKRKIYANIEPRLKDGALLATNTSALPLADLAEGLADPSRLVGLHFFNPVSRMQLIEIVSHDKISSETARRATAFSVELSRLPAPVASAPGFLVNRALTPYMAEALIMVDEGIPKERIDRAAEDFGMPMGPVELADQVGLDIAVEVSASLRERLDSDFPETPAWLERMVADGKLGRKTGAGLYAYDSDGKPKKQKIEALPDSASDDADILDRLILPMLNAVVACLREGVAESEDVADGAMIFGTGFAPFRGGPIHYAKKRGVDEIVAKLNALADKHGARFKPDAGWDRLKEKSTAVTG
ncbi:3-hydroxyacyl-CoA dehydrogenase NAD-binding domain-containing protein [Aurantimonas marina]|uniref:3-hydroxyacyl-CoA dehydrogenase NAD-binding domain-containing protein n=1 Tax=Aurantimonas marina TaxID=2780508 RepID=UPI0019D1BEFD|nr:3-hydroxyacyl-CoA dehydrogenase NAD-binding domain-containing protein [Aurantimonas marina]